MLPLLGSETAFPGGPAGKPLPPLFDFYSSIYEAKAGRILVPYCSICEITSVGGQAGRRTNLTHPASTNACNFSTHSAAEPTMQRAATSSGGIGKPRRSGATVF